MCPACRPSRARRGKGVHDGGKLNQVAPLCGDSEKCVKIAGTSPGFCSCGKRDFSTVSAIVNCQHARVRHVGICWWQSREWNFVASRLTVASLSGAPTRGSEARSGCCTVAKSIASDRSAKASRWDLIPVSRIKMISTRGTASPPLEFSLLPQR